MERYSPLKFFSVIGVADRVWRFILHRRVAKGGVPVGNTAGKSKEDRIKREKNRLNKIYKALEPGKYALAFPLIENAAFMRITLDDLQAALNDNGCSEDYRNGANQFGKKASAELQAYNSLFKNYNTVMERLEKLLPPEQRKSKLDEMRGE